MPHVSKIEGGGYWGETREEKYQEITLRELGEVRLELVRGRNDPKYRIWKEMLEEHHYLHTAKLYGQQIKYLVRSSEAGWIGAMSFSSSAWRLMYLTMQGRETPLVASDLFFSEQEIEVLKLIKYPGEYAANKGKCLSLREANLISATLGGFVKGNGREPGVEVMWRGIRRLADILIGVSLTMSVHKSDYG